MDRLLPRWKSWVHLVGTTTRPFSERFTYTVRSGIASGLKRRGGYGFLRRAMTDEEKFYLSLDFAGKVVYDVGSYEGIFSMFAARAVGPKGALVVFEPNPVNFRRTKQNLEMNDFRCSITMRNVGLGADSYSARMACPSSDFARATLNQDIARMYTSYGEVIEECEIQVERLDDAIVAGLPIPQFIKIDTEGYEYEVITGAERTLCEQSPELFIELHGTTRDHWIRNLRNVQGMITDCGYSIYDMYGRPVLGVTERVSHLYCRREP